MKTRRFKNDKKNNWSSKYAVIKDLENYFVIRLQ